MDVIATIRFVDDELGTGHVIVRAGERKVGFCLSLDQDGDSEIFFDLQTAERIRDALSRGLAQAGRDN